MEQNHFVINKINLLKNTVLCFNAFFTCLMKSNALRAILDRAGNT